MRPEASACVAAASRSTVASSTSTAVAFGAEAADFEWLAEGRWVLPSCCTQRMPGTSATASESVAASRESASD